MCRHAADCPHASAACHGVNYCTLDHYVYVGPISGPFYYDATDTVTDTDTVN